MYYCKQLANLLGLMAVTAILALYPPRVAADQLSVLADWDWSYVDTETQNKKTGEITETESSLLAELYNLSLSKQIYPNLNLQTGGILGIQNRQTEASGISSEGEQIAKSHFLQLGLNNPLLKAGAAYNKSEERSKVDRFSTTPRFQEQLSNTLRWEPIDLPSLDLGFSRSSVYDQPKTNEQTTQDLSIATRYHYQSLGLDYAHGRTESISLSNTDESRVKNIGINDSAGASYSTKAFGDQLTVDMSSRLSQSSFDLSGTNILTQPVRGVPFHIADDLDPSDNDPDQIVPSYTPDQYIDIGTGSEVDKASIGLAFDTPQSVNSIRLFPLSDFQNSDLASPLEISSVANTIDFEVYTSDDQLSWTPQVISSKTYDEFRNFFELDIVTPDTKVRYIKVTLTPLSVGVSREIRITQPQVFFRQLLASAQENNGEARDQNYNLGLRWKFSDRTSASWDAGYGTSESAISSSSSREETYSTNLGLRHRISSIFLAATNVSHYIAKDYADDTEITSTSWSSSLRADYLESFHQSFGVSYLESKQMQGTSTSESLFIRNSAMLYTDWSMNLDVIVGQSKSSSGIEGQRTAYRLSTSISPNNAMHGSLGLNYTESSQEGGGDKKAISGDAQTSWVPSRTLSLNASWSMRNTEHDGDTRKVLQNYSASWSPLLDGSLSYTLSYAKDLDNLGIGANIWSQELRWKIANGMQFSIGYSDADIETETQFQDSRSLTANFRMFL